MSQDLTGNMSRGAMSPLSQAYYHGEAIPTAVPIVERESDDYVLERAGLSSVLIARTANLITEADDSDLGYRFKSTIPNRVRDLTQLKNWVEGEAHDALDELVRTDSQVDLIAQRYEKLVVPMVVSRPKTRRDAIMFSQAVSEPEAWLRIGAIAASYHGLRIGSHQAAAHMKARLGDMQVAAKRGDIAGQNVNGAILAAAGALGTMLTPNDPEAPLRQGVLRAFVQARTSHILPAESFEDLYKVTPDQETGVTMDRRHEGFGDIPAQRDASVTCPAAYRFGDSPEDVPSTPSALFQLLRAGINAMSERNRFAEALTTRRVAVPAAVAILNAELREAGRQTLELAA